MLQQARQKITQALWNTYLQQTKHMQIMMFGLKKKNIEHCILDHFAVIDLPGPCTGIPVMQEIFSLIGFTSRGQGYLPEKQNDFLWLAEADADTRPAREVLPQVVVADFRLQEMPKEIRIIIEKYAKQAKPAPIDEIKKLTLLGQQDPDAAEKLAQLIIDYFSGRDWPMPTLKEFTTVHQFNQLLAWVLVFGRRPNHFTVSVHHLPSFANLAHFHEFVADDLQLELNHEGGVIKGNAALGLEQGSTIGIVQEIELSNRCVSLPTGFIEFIWRFANKSPAIYWSDYFTGFIAANANHVIESLYQAK